MPRNLSTNPLDHVHVRKRGKKWAYSFEKARISGKRRKEERTGYDTKKDALAAGIEAYTKYITLNVKLVVSDSLNLFVLGLLLFPDSDKRYPAKSSLA